MRATVWCLVTWLGIVLVNSENPTAPVLAWQSTDPIIPANFDAYFPDNPEAAKRLSQGTGQIGSQPSPSECIALIREGLRQAERRLGNDWIQWLGQRLMAAGQGQQQDPQAIELIYHASAHPDYQDTALYYGLSRVEKKTPAVLRRMVEIAMGSEDWINVVGHTAWASDGYRETMISFLAPYLTSANPDVRSHAQAVKRIYAGEITAQDYWKQVHTQRAKTHFADQMDPLRQRLTQGDSASRADILQTIQQNSLWLIMDDQWIDAYAAAAADSNPRIRRDVATLLGTQWFWNRKASEPVHERALELLLKLSHDTDRDVRHNVSYFGLEQLRENKAVQARLREMQSEDMEREFQTMREYALTALEQGRFEQVESMLRELQPGSANQVPKEVRRKVASFAKELESRLAEARRPYSELQSRIDEAQAHAVLDVAAGNLKGPILIEKPLTLRGAGWDQTILTYQGDGPAIMIRGVQEVRLERMAVRWAPRSTDAKIEYPAAVAVRDAQVVLESVTLTPIDRPQSTPYGLMATGRSDVQFLRGQARGFAYALIWLDGAGGKVTDSDLRAAGHSVVTVHPDAKVEVARNVLADCGYHAVRVTGGIIDMHDNIVMGCTRAGLYLGNRDAHGRVYQNLFTGNLGEIWGYYGSDVIIDHNVFYHSKDPAIIFWNTCALGVRSNSFTANPAALRQYVQANDPARVGVHVEGNHYWANQEIIQPGRKTGKDAGVDERFQLAPSPTALEGDPKFRDPASGDFTPREGSVLLRDGGIVAGLLDPQSIHQLARRYQLRFP